MMEKNGLQTFIMTIIGIAVLLTIGLVILQQFQTSIGDRISATSVSNESVTYVNATNVALANTGFEFGSCSAVRNASHAVVGAGNYTCSASGIIATNTTGSGLENSNTIYVDYSYKAGDAAYTATGTNITKLATVPTWIGILITVALAFIVLGYFYSRK